MNSEALDWIDWVGIVTQVLDRHPDASVPQAAIDEIADKMRNTCQAVFRGAVTGMKRSVDKHVALGVIRDPKART